MAAKRHKKVDSEQIQRFGLQFRIQHGVLMLSVVTLIVTGILLWCLARPDYIWWSRKFHMIQVAQWLHRIAGSVLLVLSLYHLIYMFFSREGRQEFWNLLPRWKDVTDLFANLAYFLHLRKAPPRFDRFTYYEKFDYWAVYWGSVIMIATGLVLWFDRFSAKYLPWFPYKLAAEVHADEAILAALAIFIWHFYNVHYKPEKFPGSGTWIHGRISKEEMLEFHPLEYERMTAREKDEDNAK
jgi:cytochrome b subunit of formate dehydrogenase